MLELQAFSYIYGVGVLHDGGGSQALIHVVHGRRALADWHTIDASCPRITVYFSHPGDSPSLHEWPSIRSMDGWMADSLPPLNASSLPHISVQFTVLSVLE